MKRRMQGPVDSHGLDGLTSCSDSSENLAKTRRSFDRQVCRGQTDIRVHAHQASSISASWRSVRRLYVVSCFVFHMASRSLREALEIPAQKSLYHDLCSSFILASIVERRTCAIGKDGMT